MKYSSLFTGGLMIAVFLASCTNEPRPDETKAAAIALKEQTVTIRSDSASLISFLVYNDSVKTRRPAVIVVPEWWGLTEYPKMRARELAKLGYVALALDMYGDGKIAAAPDSAMAFSGPFYKSPEMSKARIDAAIAALKANPLVDTANIAAIGYCFGGGILLNTARLGDELKGVVSFHGALLGTPARKDLLRTKILVCYGNADKFETPAHVATFKKQMDSIGASYTFIGYDSAGHAFTNPAATELGLKFKLPIAYNAKADTASWNDMKTFLSGLFSR
jgi:dienelactone hydrolase